MGLKLSSGGHLTHGFYNKFKNVSITSQFYSSLYYGLDENNIIDYDKLEELALQFCPKLIFIGASAYSLDYDYERFVKIKNKINCYLVADIAHYNGLISAGLMNNCFKYVDVVTMTTHKIFNGPRGALIYYKKEYEKRINDSVFPGTQGGPHNEIIAGICAQAKFIDTQEYKDKMKQTLKNSKDLCNYLMDKGYKIISNKTQNHLFL